MAGQRSAGRADGIAAVPDEIYQGCGRGGAFFCLSFSPGRVRGGEKADQNQTDGLAARKALVAAGIVDVDDKIML